MKTTALVVQLLVRAMGLAQVGLGILFWTGTSRQLIPLHMLTGIGLVLCLWVMAALGAWARVHPGRIALAVFWGFFVPVFGVVHGGVLMGDWHWVIQVLHLLVGLALIGQTEALAVRIRRREVQVDRPLVASPVGTAP